MMLVFLKKPIKGSCRGTTFWLYLTQIRDELISDFTVEVFSDFTAKNDRFIHGNQLLRRKL